MWHYVFVLITTILCLCLLIIGSKRANLITSTSVEFNFINAREFLKQDNFSGLLTSDEKSTKSVKRKIHIPKFMLDLYEERKREDYALNFSKPDIVRSVIPKTAGTLQNSVILQSFEENHMLLFDIPSSNADETFLDAELRILTLVNFDADAVIGVERSITVSVYNESLKKLYRLDERHVYHSDNTWITFNMTVPVSRLLTKYSKHKFLKLVISVEAFLPFINYNKDHFKLSLLPISEGTEYDYPILLLSYMTLKENVHIIKPFGERKKRSVEEDYEEETNRIWDNDQQNKAQTKKLKRLKNTCKRKQLYVDFAEIQYDSWIVQPSGYEAYQCTGKCFYPVAQHLSPTKHAIVQALLHSVAPSRAPRSCCVPSKLESISLLYVDEKGVLTYRYGYNDMVVVECGCR